MHLLFSCPWEKNGKKCPYSPKRTIYSERTEEHMRRRRHRKPPVMLLSLLIGLSAAVLWGGWSLRAQRELADKVVRLHVLANSDSEADQALKLQVRDTVLTRAEELLVSSDGRQEAEAALREHLPELTALAQTTVAAEGYTYSVRTELANTVFPPREYEDFSLPAGSYLALRVVIGDGAGKNWWCVVFPPLCAQSTTDLAQTAMAAGLSDADVRLMEETTGRYQLKFKSIEIWEWLRQKFS